MPDYSLVPVDHQEDFDDYSLVPVDYDPFAADGVTQQAQIQVAQAQLQGLPQQRPATGAGQPDAGAPAAGDGSSGSRGGAIGPPTPTLDQGAAKAPPFGGYSLVPVDYKPDFNDYPLVPVDYYPFVADGLAQQAQIQQPPTPTQPAQPQPQTQPQQPAAGVAQPDVNGPATGNVPGRSGGDFRIKRFGGAEGGHFPSRNAGIGFKSADSAWYAALEEMKDLGAQHYPEEAKSRGFIPELGVEIHRRGGLYYYDQIARGFQDGAGLAIAVRSHVGTCIGKISTKAMEIKTTRGPIPRKFQTIKHGLDLGMGSDCIGIRASQRSRGCLIGIDTNIEACR